MVLFVKQYWDNTRSVTNEMIFRLMYIEWPNAYWFQCNNRPLMYMNDWKRSRTQRTLVKICTKQHTNMHTKIKWKRYLKRYIYALIAILYVYNFDAKITYAFNLSNKRVNDTCWHFHQPFTSYVFHIAFVWLGVCVCLSSLCLFPYKCIWHHYFLWMSFEQAQMHKYTQPILTISNINSISDTK